MKKEDSKSGESKGSAAKDFVVVDIETTGLSKDWHRITEIAAVHMRASTQSLQASQIASANTAGASNKGSTPDAQPVILNQFQTLVNPECHIPSFITGLTGIDDEMVKDAPTVQEALPSFLEFLGPHVFVAHNATFDFNFISHNAAKHHSLTLENDLLCTRRLASRLLPEGSSRRLGAVTAHFNITNAQAHRAMGDAMATAHVLNRFLQQLHQNGIKDLDEVLRFQLRSRRECQRLLDDAVATQTVSAQTHE